MESIIKDALNTTTLEATGIVGKGCINEGEVYVTDHGRVFLKKNSNPQAREMFDGEFESLKTIQCTNIIKVPKPLIVVDNPTGGAVLAMEYLQFKNLGRKANLLGEQMARLHLNNIELEDKVKIIEQYIGATEKDKYVQYISKFGFHVQTWCGYHLQNNNWCGDWTEFFGRKLEDQINRIEMKYCDREALQLWSILKMKLPDFFNRIDIKPSLLHGDLWISNVGETDNDPVILDAASFYGHFEYDLAIAGRFGSFPNSFIESYYKIMPKTEGWYERQQIYGLFFNLNQWFHFGSKYRSKNIELMKELIKLKSRN